MEKQTNGLTPSQLHILQMFNYTQSEDELKELKKVLANFYAEKADQEMDKIWDEKSLTPDMLKKMANEHHRTPYK